MSTIIDTAPMPNTAATETPIWRPRAFDAIRGCFKVPYDEQVAPCTLWVGPNESGKSGRLIGARYALKGISGWSLGQHGSAIGGELAPEGADVVWCELSGPDGKMRFVVDGRGGSWKNPAPTPQLVGELERRKPDLEHVLPLVSMSALLHFGKERGRRELMLRFGSSTKVVEPLGLLPHQRALWSEAHAAALKKLTKSTDDGTIEVPEASETMVEMVKWFGKRKTEASSQLKGLKASVEARSSLLLERSAGAEMLDQLQAQLEKARRWEAAAALRNRLAAIEQDKAAYNAAATEARALFAQPLPEIPEVAVVSRNWAEREQLVALVVHAQSALAGLPVVVDAAVETRREQLFAQRRLKNDARNALTRAALVRATQPVTLISEQQVHQGQLTQAVQYTQQLYEQALGQQGWTTTMAGLLQQCCVNAQAQGVTVAPCPVCAQQFQPFGALQYVQQLQAQQQGALQQYAAQAQAARQALDAWPKQLAAQAAQQVAAEAAVTDQQRQALDLEIETLDTEAQQLAVERTARQAAYDTAQAKVTQAERAVSAWDAATTRLQQQAGQSTGPARQARAKAEGERAQLQVQLVDRAARIQTSEAEVQTRLAEMGTPPAYVGPSSVALEGELKQLVDAAAARKQLEADAANLALHTQQRDAAKDLESKTKKLIDALIARVQTTAETTVSKYLPRGKTAVLDLAGLSWRIRDHNGRPRSRHAASGYQINTLVPALAAAYTENAPLRVLILDDEDLAGVGMEHIADFFGALANAVAQGWITQVFVAANRLEGCLDAIAATGFKIIRTAFDQAPASLPPPPLDPIFPLVDLAAVAAALE